MKIQTNNKLFIISILVLSIIFCWCGGSDVTGPKSAAADLSGTWIIQQTINGNCQSTNYPEYKTEVAVITQSGNNLTISFSSTGLIVNGVISGSKVTWKASIPDGDGTLTMDFSGTVAAGGSSLTGSATWEWSDGSYSCSGTTEVTALKAGGAANDVSGTWEGSYQSSSYTTMNGTFTVKITQQDSSLYGFISVPEMYMTEEELTGTIIGNAITFGDIEGEITFTGIVIGDSVSSGTYSYPLHGDNGSWQATKSDSSASSVAVWQKSDIGFAFVEQERLILGNGRDDGVIRVYSGDGIWGNDGNIYEFSYNNSQWEQVSFGESTYGLSHITGINIGAGRNDEITRVYASGYNIFEHYYDSNLWTWEQTVSDIGWTNDLVLGNARNDGMTRLYIAEHDGIVEYSYNNGNWDKIEISTGGQSIGRLLITDGRNDGTLRLYAATDWGDHVYEYSWTGSTWQIEDCGATGNGSFSDIDAGAGRNDGINRIYLAANWGIYELSYDGQNWQYNEIGSVSSAWAIAIGNGRNDDINRIYVSENQDALVEYSYSGGWSKTSAMDSGFRVNDIAIGNGRNDSVNRVYVTASDSHLYEYTVDY